MSTKPLMPILAGLRRAFLAVNTLNDLCELLAIDVLRLQALALQPRYNVFTIPKKNGKLRLIEDPHDDLQGVQSTLNDYLQAIYWHQRSPAAYGFLVVPSGDPSPRHIETNAALHLHHPWMLNCDLSDFFHQITQERVIAVLSESPFRIDRDSVNAIARICTFKGRCPMGAPTSPVLSNLVFASVDHDLLALATKRGWTYSRYADDLTFSSHDALNWDDYTAIQRIVTKQHGFEFNPEKVQLFPPEAVKTVTGLTLGLNGLEIPVDFISGLSTDIKQLEAALTVQFRAGAMVSKPNERFQRSVWGKLQFMARIMGTHHPAVIKLEQAYQGAIAPPTDLEMRSWFDFGYF
jgi:RNA-directed DNA polymerase